MFGTETMAIVCGVGSALSWGAADFSGGLATRNDPVLKVLLLSQVLGLGLLLMLVPFSGEGFPGVETMAWGALAGLFGAFGIGALYRGLARGPMGLVAPVSSVVAALVPVGVAMVRAGLPNPLQWIGMASALSSVWLISGGGRQGRVGVEDLRLPLAAGIGFGLFFVCIDAAGQTALVWPLVAARAASVAAVAPVVLWRGAMTSLSPGRMPLIALAGILDTAGNAFFILAARMGRLDIAAVLTSLYPAATVLLAWIVLRERIGRRQGIGVVLAVSALVLIGG